MTNAGSSRWTPPARPNLDLFVPRERRVAPLVVWLGCLAAAIALLVWLGDGRLAAPDLTAPRTWGDWARDRGTSDVVVSVLRVGALALAWYLAGVTSVSVLARAAGAARLVRVADALSVGPVRTVVQQALGVGLAVGVVAGAVPSAVGTGSARAVAPAPVVTGQPIDPGPGDPSVAGVGATDLPVRPPSRAQSTMDARPPVPAPGAGHAEADLVDRHRGRHATAIDDRPDAGLDAGAEARGDRLPRSDPPGRSAGPPVEATVGHVQVRVAPGDHLWGLAERQLWEEFGRSPSEAEVLAHWERVVQVNRERLEVPGNPDLIRPGQRLLLPPPEPAP